MCWFLSWQTMSCFSMFRMHSLILNGFKKINKYDITKTWSLQTLKPSLSWILKPLSEDRQKQGNRCVTFFTIQPFPPFLNNLIAKTTKKTKTILFFYSRFIKQFYQHFIYEINSIIYLFYFKDSKSFLSFEIYYLLPFSFCEINMPYCLLKWRTPLTNRRSKLLLVFRNWGSNKGH